MEKILSDDLIWLINKKTKECDVFFIKKNYLKSLINNKVINPNDLYSESNLLSTNTVCDYLGIKLGACP